MILIDKDPPALTGNRDADLKAMYEFLMYLKEQLNFILTNIERETTNA